MQFMSKIQFSVKENDQSCSQSLGVGDFCFLKKVGVGSRAEMFADNLTKMVTNVTLELWEAECLNLQGKS